MKRAAAQVSCSGLLAEPCRLCACRDEFLDHLRILALLLGPIS